MRRLFIGLLLALVALPAWAQTAPPADQAALAATWLGAWTRPGYVYEAELHMTVSAQNVVDGNIHWTLRQTPVAGAQSKIGLTGTEYIRGAYLPAARLLRFDGYKKDDPNVILGLDKYRLVLSDDDKVIGGITWANGDWAGRFSLGR
jgi:hypothetical protein